MMISCHLLCVSNSQYSLQSLKEHITQMSLQGSDWQTRLIYLRPGYRWNILKRTSYYMQ